VVAISSAESSCILKTFGLHDFAPYRNTIFGVTEAPGYAFELAEITDQSNKRLEQFSLIFTCPVLPWLPQGTYTLTHPDLNDVSLFLVPLGPDGNTMRYESAFSRLMAEQLAEKV
jgi:hypothetical protein